MILTLKPKKKMPELPEVETIVSDLNKKIKGYKVIDFKTNWSKSIKGCDWEDFKKEILGQTIEKAERRGKNILIYFKRKGGVMLIHLKMTGHLLVKPSHLSNKEKELFDQKVNQYIHHSWKLIKNGREINLDFSDLRKFGKIRFFYDKEELEKEVEIKNLGVDPTGEKFTFNLFLKILRKNPQMNVRNFLMDQKKIAGIGNIYASEILFEAKISPFRKVFQLKSEETENFFKAIKKIIDKAIRNRGTSDSDYRDTAGRKGNFQNLLKVYGREKKPCKRKSCQGVIKRVKINQRSAFFCPLCQK